MNHQILPPTIAPPAANYAHAVLSVDASRLLYTSGVLPTRLDGTVPEAIEDQAVVVWQTIEAILAEADMLLSSIVSITTYVVVDHLGALAVVMAARDAALGGHRAASTLVTVPALARPEWKMEIAVVAVA